MKYKCISALLIGVLCSFSWSLLAQDTITKKDGTEIQARVTEVGTNEVKYTRFGTTVPTYTLLKSDIFMIKYEDGTKEMFEENKPAIEVYDKVTEIPLQPIYTYTFGNPINPVGEVKSPWTSGVASFFLPGLGQFINGDVRGGLIYMGGSFVCYSLMLDAMINNNRMGPMNDDNNRGSFSTIDTKLAIGALGYLTFFVASIVDAAQMANKVNLVRGYRMMRNTYLNIQPAIITQDNLFNNRDYAYGMKLKLNF